jgi:glycerophosphoryl diester phosphodiesterase
MHDRKLVVAHRGDHSASRENTLDAFQAAIAAGADMIEFDVHRSADGVLVVNHDDAILGGPIAALEFATLQRLAGSCGYALPRAADVAALAKGRIRLDAEIKQPGIEAALLAAFFDAGLAIDDFVVTSFYRDVLSAVSAVAPTVRTGFLVEARAGRGALDGFAAVGAAFFAPEWPLLDDEMLQSAHGAGVELLPWTVNDADTIRRLLAADAVSGIITDRVAEALRVRDSLSVI